ncbi:hypothetical protein F8M41_008546 [Gigaspora margarita]|uniref:Uncharacterized protein n=1 Tax=Gigaspora margarita TaxID=4874 RepID=A0A8H4EV24_GIGMA|nr:hypothetical protein F8M41_008546 [Gigaspora margarita]
MEELSSDTDPNTLEDIGFVNEMDSVNEINYNDEMNLDNNNLEQGELAEEQINNTMPVEERGKKNVSTCSKKQKCNIENSESETETSTSVVTTKSSIVQHKLPGRRKGSSQFRSWVWNHFDRKTPPPDKAVRGEC